MTLPFRRQADRNTRPLTLVTKSALPQWMRQASGPSRRWIRGTGFTAEPGQMCLVPGRDGAPARVLAGIAGDATADDLWHAAALPTTLPRGSYRLDPEPADLLATRVAIGWGLGSYSFNRYREAGRAPAQLVWPRGAARAHVERTVRAAALVRDLVNTPAEDTGSPGAGRGRRGDGHRAWHERARRSGTTNCSRPTIR